VLVAALIAVAKVVTPTVVPTLVPTALRHQNTAIAVLLSFWQIALGGIAGDRSSLPLLFLCGLREILNPNEPILFQRTSSSSASQITKRPGTSECGKEEVPGLTNRDDWLGRTAGYSRNESGELMFPSGPALVNSSRSGEEHRA
jgi:hypothetical protein